ncbi:unnamed protein product [Microthlaspi erraticum]|uniref:Uncharacterized protein n=1 Tax=Microthlaspi erraticum TaxID=1685480 RepID=A0A6D2IP21_9BRAS|nr:unnamed protein product [Microthlaspi erraticum]
MEEQRGASSVEPPSNSGLLGQKRNGNGLAEKDELGSKRVKLRDLDSDAKTSDLQSDKGTGIVQQPNLSSKTPSGLYEMVVAHAKGLATSVVREKEALAKDTSLPKANKDDNLSVAKSGKEAVLVNHPVKDGNNCDEESLRGRQVDAVLKNSSVLKPKETSETVSPVGAVESDSMCSAPPGSLEKSDSMRRWMEMKKNGFLSGPLGGVPAPSSAVASTTTPVETQVQKQQKNKRRSDSFKKRNEVAPPRKEQQLIDRFSNVTAPSGLLTELNPGIINHVRSKKQVCSIIEALIRNATDDGERNANLNVRDSVREDRALAFKLPSTGVPDNVNSIANQEQATSLAVEAATVASQWLEFLHQDLSGRLSAVQDSRNRVKSVLTTEIPHLVSSTESSSNQESKINTSGVASSDKTVTETHQIRWSAKFDQINKALYDEERDLEHSLNQVKEMQSRCNEGLRQMDEYSPFSSQSSDSSFGNQETSMAVQAAAASIFSTCSFLLSMMKPPSATGS